MQASEEFKSDKEALGALLDLIQYKRLLDGLKLNKEELLTFQLALKQHDHAK